MKVAGCYQSEPLRTSLAKMIEKLCNCKIRLTKFLDRKKAIYPNYKFMPLHEIIEAFAKKTD